MAVQIQAARVEELASHGLSMKQIALCLGIGRSTLYRKKGENRDIRDAIERGRAKGLSAVANALFEAATTKGNYQAQQFYLRNRDPERWKEHRHATLEDNRRSLSEIGNDELKDMLEVSKAA